MREAIGQSKDPNSRQANSEITAGSARIIHDSLDLVQRSPWNFGINMDKPKDVAARSPRTSIHLSRPTTLTYNKLIAKAPCEVGRAVGASTVHDNDLRSSCPLTHVSKKRLYQRRLIDDWDDDRSLHLIYKLSYFNLRTFGIFKE
jgi:hypothetical protein